MDIIDINNFSKMDEEKQYKLLNNNTKKLIKEICKQKNIKIQNNDFYHASEEIYYNSVCFSSAYSLCNRLEHYINNKNTEDIEEDEDDDIDTGYDKLNIYSLDATLGVYNDLVKELKNYKEIKKMIAKEGFTKLETKYKKELIEIFYKMLDFKNRKYNKKSTIEELIKEVDLCYHDYYSMWEPLYQILVYNCIYKDTEKDDRWKIMADDVEHLWIIKDTYDFFAEDEERYKNYDNYYEDITLEENQTLEDLYDSERKKLKDLYIEMLNYKNVKIEKYEESYLALLVEKNYPKFEDSFNYFEYAKSSIYYSYIDLIKITRDLYNSLKKNYKKY